MKDKVKNLSAKRNIKLSCHEQVTEFIEKADHPLKPAMKLLREIVVSADERIDEQIKWNAPSFCVDGEDRVTFNLHKKDHILVIFHRGAKVEKGSVPDKRLFDDQTGLLQWLTNDRAAAKLCSTEEVRAKRSDLAKLVKQWIAATEYVIRRDSTTA